jgi:DNA-binding LytR/AlgR family response regulator
MIKILIIEDEIPARKKLKRFLEELNASIEIVSEIDTVGAAVTFLQTYSVDLIFSDIELLDGNAFEVYGQVSVSCPIIFTTAYDQFYMKAFESAGIDYLLKPYSNIRFKQAWDKFLLLRKPEFNNNDILANLTKLITQKFENKQFKKRYTVHTNQGIHFLDTENVAFFEANEGVIFAFDATGKKHLLSATTLKEIEDELNPLDFFRINRSELIGKQHIERIERYHKNALSVKMKGYEKHLQTSQSTTSAFRTWIEQ